MDNTELFDKYDFSDIYSDDNPFQCEENFFDEEPEYQEPEEMIKDEFLNFEKNEKNQEPEPRGEESCEESFVNEVSENLFERASVSTYKQKPEDDKIHSKVKNSIPNFMNEDLKKEEKIKTESTVKSPEYDMDFDNVDEYLNQISQSEDAVEEVTEETIEEEQNKVAEEIEVEIIGDEEDSETEQQVSKQYDYVIKQSKKIPEWGKKIIAFVAMLAFVLGIPLIFGMAGNKRAEKENTHILKSSTYKEETVNVENSLFESVREWSEESLQNNATSGRFSGIDELTLYINSNTGSLLSSEMQAVNMFNNGNITADEFVEQMNMYIESANEINHLMMVNKAVYDDNGLSEEYEEMFDNLESLLIYGDTAMYNFQINIK